MTARLYNPFMISRRDVLAQLAMAGIVARFAPRDLFAQTQTAAQRYGKEKLIVRSMRPPDFETPVALLDSFITPNELFYVRSHMPVPQVDAAAWTLKIGGEVNSPIVALARRDQEASRRHRDDDARVRGQRTRVLRAALAGIQWEKGAVGTARFTGARHVRRAEEGRRQDDRPQRRDARRRSSARHHARVRAAGADGQGDASRHHHRVGHERPADPAGARLAAARDHSRLGGRVFGEVAERAQRAREGHRQLLGRDRLPLSEPARRARRRGGSRRTWSRSPAWW